MAAISLWASNVFNCCPIHIFRITSAGLLLDLKRVVVRRLILLMGR